MTAVADAAVVPHSLDAERAVLGAILVAPIEAWGVVASVMKEGDFFRVAHQQIYRAMGQLSENGTEIDLLTVKELLLTMGQLDATGGPAYLASLTDGVPRTTNVAHYAEIVMEKSRLRVVRTVGDWVVQAAQRAETPAVEVADEAARRLAETVGTAAHAQTVGEAAQAYLTEIDEDTSAPMPFGYSDIDRMMGGGLRPGRLMIVAARPSVGKTTWSLRVAQHLAERGQGVVFFSLELGVRPVAGRLMAWRSGVPQADIERADLSDSDMGRVSAELTALADIPLVLDDTAETLSQIRGVVRKLRHQMSTPPRCVVVDYLQLLATERQRRTITEEVSGLSRGLKRLAQQEDVAMVALSQLSRAPESRPDKRPQMSDLRDSGALEQDADIVLLLFRPDMYTPTTENRGVTEVIVAKNRQTGRTGTVLQRFDRDLAVFQDLAQGAMYGSDQDD